MTQKPTDHDQLDALLEHLPLGVYRTTPDGEILMANRALLQMLGFQSFEDLCRQTLTDDNFGSGNPRAEFVRKIEEQGQVNGFSAVWKRQDGSELPVRESARRVADDSGQTLFYEGVVEDVSGHQAMEASLRESELRYRQLIESLPHCVGIIQHMKVIFVNGAVCTMLGYGSPGEVVGREATFGLAPQEHQRVVPLLLEAMDGDGPWPVHLLVQAVRKDGSTFPAELFCSSITYGHERAMQLVVMDITEREVARKERERLLEQLHQDDRLSVVGQLAAGVAHEVNNPLAFVLPSFKSLSLQTRVLCDLARMVADGERPDKVRAFVQDMGGSTEFNLIAEHLDTCRDGLERIEQVSRDLKNYTRVDKSQGEPVRVTELLESSLRLMDQQLRYRARIERRFEQVPTITGHAAQLSQVFLNVLINAMQAIPDGTPWDHYVRVSTSLEGDRVLIEIANSGEVITPENQKRVFDPYFSTRSEGPMAGLGLAISHSIVKQHMGEITLSSSVEDGTRFRITLPLEGLGYNTGILDGPQESRFPETTRILVVDDEPAILRVYSRFLDRFRVVLLDSGQAALEHLAANPSFDVIVCDLMMPGTSGMDVFREATARQADLSDRFIFVTGGAYTPAARKFLSQVNPRLISKPMDCQDLLEAIEQLLDEQG